MATTAEIAAKIIKFFTASDKGHDIVNGPATGEGSTVAVESGTVKTFARTLAEFETAGAAAVEAFESGISELLVVGNTVPINGIINITGDAADDGFPLGPIELPFFDVWNGKHRFLDLALSNAKVYWMSSSNAWFFDISDVTLFQSSAPVATPDLVPAGAWDAETNPNGWEPLGLSSGTPIVALTLATAAPPYIRVADGKFFVRENGIWKSANLSI